MTTAPTSLEVPTLEQLLLRIEETKPILAANVDDTEANRRIAQANIDPLSDAGAFKVKSPPVRWLPDEDPREAGGVGGRRGRPAVRPGGWWH